MVRETSYKLLYHTFKHEGEVEAEDLRQQQCRVLQFLRRKFMSDLEAGEKILVWKTTATPTPEGVEKLLLALRRRGPNRLLWVSHEDADHPPGTIERLESDLVRGYIAGKPQDNIFDFVAEPWFKVCRAAFEMFRP